MTKQRADMALVARGLFESRARAQAAIAAGLVTANGALVKKPSDMIADEAHVNAQAPHPYVSRGGVKLAHALDYFQITIDGLRCLDVGASTGGFTNALLARGAAHVTAVDTGRDQFHARLRGDPRIALHEQTDIRKADPVTLGAPFDCIAVDVSFISLRLIIPALSACARVGAQLVTLVKPQFEVGRGALGKNGIVTDRAAQEQAVQNVTDALAQAGWKVTGSIDSPIAGGDGNREFLVYAVKS
ncbi:MAG: TlyA family RNA methyltransferase [Beijerinckiaceae bacterium]